MTGQKQIIKYNIWDLLNLKLLTNLEFIISDFQNDIEYGYKVKPLITNKIENQALNIILGDNHKGLSIQSGHWNDENDLKKYK